MDSPAPSAPAGVILGHSNMDPDCLGSIALARYLYPDHVALRSRRIHPLALPLYRLFQEELDLRDPSATDFSRMEHAVVVDTHSLRQIREYFEPPRQLPPAVTVYDHHRDGETDIPGARYTRHHYGANTTILCMCMLEKGLRPSPEDATLALAGIVADTGSFSHANVHSRDLAAAMWLLDQGADLGLVHKLTHFLLDEDLDRVLHELMGAREHHRIRGHKVVCASARLDRQDAGLSLVAEKLAEFEEADAVFCLFDFPGEESHLLVARSARPDIDVAWVLQAFGGGGHPQAAAAQLRKSSGIPVDRILLHLLEERLQPSLTAGGMMHQGPALLDPAHSVMAAALCLEDHNAQALPVCSREGKLEGMFSLKELQKARKAQAMHAPVSAYMTRKLVTLAPGAGLRDVEKAFLQHDLSLVPVVEGEMFRGLISRRDFLARLRTPGMPDPSVPDLTEAGSSP